MSVRNPRNGACGRQGRVPVPVEIRRALARLRKVWAMQNLHVSAIMYDELISPFGYAQIRIIEKVTRLLVELGELPSIEELIARSSLGTPEAVAIRAQAPREVVEAVLKKVGGGR